MEYINDLINVYKKAAKDTLELIVNIPIIVFLPLIYSFAIGIIIMLSVKFGFGFSGFFSVIYVLVEAMLLSSYFSQMNDGLTYKKLSLKFNSFQGGFFTFLWNIYFMGFIFYLVSLLLGVMKNWVISLACFILFNAAGEAIYIRNVQREETFLYSMNYLKDNWHLWLPVAVLGIFFSGYGILYVPMNPLDMYLTHHGFYFNSQTILLIMSGVYFVFRGILFKNTYNSTIRKRKYMGWY